MRTSRVRLTVRTMMIAVAAVALVLAVERFLYRSATRAVSSHAESDYIWGEAVTVWLILNVALLVHVGMISQMARAYMAHHADGQKRIG